MASSAATTWKPWPVESNDCPVVVSNKSGSRIRTGYKFYTYKKTGKVSQLFVAFLVTGEAMRKHDVDFKSSVSHVFGERLETTKTWNEWERSFHAAWNKHYQIPLPLKTDYESPEKNQAKRAKRAKAKNAKNAKTPTSQATGSAQHDGGASAFINLSSGKHICDCDLPALSDYIKTHFALRSAPPADLLRKTNSFIEETGDPFWNHEEFLDFYNSNKPILGDEKAADPDTPTDEEMNQWTKEWIERCGRVERELGIDSKF
ncbi:hypothetical protein DM02DRAFT_661975 [Periconia macrospinosa]|uniref:Uncharacterized protein n=1 Tax=Periconia macrospinosa TaxID=97972 RepID=A0A2V1D5V7_9PLEO|nr:hypothetical protein DM02DRAFT_661975 [Periconia macrospinosa]